MDRLEAMKVFIAALDEGSLAGAGRKLGRSPAAVSRTIAFLEHHAGAELLHRTTRSIKLSEVGERYATACRRVLLHVVEADMSVAGERSTPRGTLTIAAPPICGEEILGPIVDAYLNTFPEVSVNLLILERNANLVEEGIDIWLRVAQLPDSSMVAVRIGGDVKRVVVASPLYLANNPPVLDPADLTSHRIVTTPLFGQSSWVFPPSAGSTIARSIQFRPRLVVNSVRAALASAVEGHGITRLFAYHVVQHVRDGSLKILLRDEEPAALPVHLVTPEGRMSVPKVRAFVDFAVPRLRAAFTSLASQADALGQ